MLKYSGGNECRGASKLVPSAWNIPTQNAGRSCRIWTLMEIFPLGITFRGVDAKNAKAWG